MRFARRILHIALALIALMAVTLVMHDAMRRREPVSGVASALGGVQAIAPTPASGLAATAAGE